MNKEARGSDAERLEREGEREREREPCVGMK